MGFQGEDYFFKCEAFYHAVDAAFAVSPEIAKRAERRTRRAPEIIPNPVDTAFFKPLQPSVSQSFTIAASGRIVGWKGYDHLINALARIRQNGYNLQLSIAGEGPELPTLKSLAASLHVDHAVQFHGKLNPEALRNLLQTATLYVQPSIGIEAFSISALEAAACGLPLILSDQVGLSHFLDSEDYIRYPAQDSNALVQAITTALHRQDRNWWDAEARHQRIHAKFSPQVVAEKILALAFPSTHSNTP
jgi:glycosyltransferase involved in cell wall biosynthesis